FEIARSAIVEYANVARPRPSPTRMESETRRVGRISARSVIDDLAVLFSDRSAIEPATRTRRAVRLQCAHARRLMISLKLYEIARHHTLAIGPHATAHLFEHFEIIGLLAVIPDRIQYRSVFRILRSAIEIAHALENLIEYLKIGFCFAGRIHALVAPLQPAAAVSDAARLFEKTCGRQQQNFRRH